MTTTTPTKSTGTNWIGVIDQMIPFKDKRHELMWRQALAVEITHINRCLSNMFSSFNEIKDKEGKAWLKEANDHLVQLHKLYQQRETPDWVPPKEAVESLQRTEMYEYPKRKSAEDRIGEIFAAIRKHTFKIAAAAGISIGLIISLAVITYKTIMLLWR